MVIWLVLVCIYKSFITSFLQRKTIIFYHLQIFCTAKEKVSFTDKLFLLPITTIFE